MMQQLAFELEPAPNLAPAPTRVGYQWRVVQRNGVTLGYSLRRSRRRSIGLVVGDDGLRVTAPHWVSLRQIDEAVLEKFDWVQRKQQIVQVRQQRLDAAQSNWRDGGCLAFLGQRLQLLCAPAPDAAHRGQAWLESEVVPPAPGTRLWLPLAADAGVERIRDMAQGWLQRQAQQWFEQRLQAFERSSGLKPRDWRLSSATTRWGACNSDGRVTLNWRLIQFETTVIDYVIAHELAHLKQLNHSQAFWAVLRSIYPDYLKGHQALKGLTPGDTPAL